MLLEALVTCSNPRNPSGVEILKVNVNMDVATSHTLRTLNMNLHEREATEDNTPPTHPPPPQPLVPPPKQKQKQHVNAADKLGCRVF